MTTLADIPVGGRAKVKSLVDTGEVTVRLMEMGLTPGVEVMVLGTAPLGDPIEIRLRGYRLSLRRSEARLVSVEPFEIA